MSGVKNNVGRGINVALVNGKWHFKWADGLRFQIVYKISSKILGDSETQAGAEKKVSILIVR